MNSRGKERLGHLKSVYFSMNHIHMYEYMYPRLPVLTKSYIKSLESEKVELVLFKDRLRRGNCVGVLAETQCASSQLTDFNFSFGR